MKKALAENEREEAEMAKSYEEKLAAAQLAAKSNVRA